MNDIQTLFESLKVVRKGSEDDFELRASDDEKLWGVKLFADNPDKPTYALYAGPEAREYACEAADYDVDDEEEDEDEDDD
jgi:hypothetical protein